MKKIYKIWEEALNQQKDGGNKNDDYVALPTARFNKLYMFQ